MKNAKKIVASALVLFVIGTKANAQSTEQAQASATIVAPISLTWKKDMAFGNLAVKAAGGTVVLNAQTGVRTSPVVVGGVTFPNVTGTVQAAEFEVEGEVAYTYAITLPSTDLTLVGATANMIANTFTSFPATTGTLDAITGKQKLTVGASLVVGADQAAGLYQSADFDVTVNYN